MSAEANAGDTNLQAFTLMLAPSPFRQEQPYNEMTWQDQVLLPFLEVSPVASSTSIHPTDQMSHGKDHPRPRMTSGAL